jgi:release factor glutamine methyltransferase
MKIKELLKVSVEELKKFEIEDANLKAKILLSEVLGKGKEYLLIHDNDELSSEIVDVYNKMIERVKNGEPIQYILNKQEFMGLDFYVDKNVLIPQPDTENLVEEVIAISEDIKKTKNEIRILDMCTGSGAIAVSLAKYVEKTLIYASDISKEALNIAKLNAKNNEVQINLIESDLFENIHEYDFDIIVSPYLE